MFKILDEQIAWPINHVTINCDKANKLCEYNQIVLDLPSENSFAQMYNVIDMGTDTYKITRWENYSIDAVSTNNASCRTSSPSFNFKTKEFYETVRNAVRKCEFLGTVLPKLQKPRTSQIVDGKEIFRAKFSKIKARAYSYLASDFRKQAEALRKK